MANFRAELRGQQIAGGQREKGSGSFARVGSGQAAWSEFHGDNEPDPISLMSIGWAEAAVHVGAAHKSTVQMSWIILRTVTLTGRDQVLMHQ